MSRKLFVLTGALALLALAVPAYAGHSTNDLNCNDFTYQQDAQDYLALHPGDPDMLDDDNDGEPCESLPDRPAVSPSPTPIVSVSPTPSPTPTTAAVCHTAYSGVCFDAAALDVDCAGGEGDGPVFTTATNFALTSITNDPFELDRDHDGMGCEAEDIAAAAPTPATPAAPTPAAQPTPIDASKAKVLSRTGSESLPLLAFALALFALGSLCLSADRRGSAD